jgi:hypothetical protein
VHVRDECDPHASELTVGRWLESTGERRVATPVAGRARDR